VQLTIETKPYKLEPIHIPMRLDKLVDVSVGHQFGYHREGAIAHCHSQQREHIQMAEAFPHYNLFVEHLPNCSQLLTTDFRQTFDGDPLW